MMRLTYMDKRKKETWLPQMFALFHENMHQFLHDYSPYKIQTENWMSEISPALDKDPRQVILCLDGDNLAGFLMYYTRQELLMVEEVQIQKECQRTSLFLSLCRFLGKNLSAEIQYIEAFAHESNLYSQQLMKKIGMKPVDNYQYPGLVHLQGKLHDTEFSRFIRQF